MRIGIAGAGAFGAALAVTLAQGLIITTICRLLHREPLFYRVLAGF